MAVGTEISSRRREALARIEELAAEPFAARAEEFDRKAEFPRADFEDLFRAGLLAPALPEKFGGLGLGPGQDTLTLWHMTVALARANMSLARCWEGHVNSQLILARLGTAEQQTRWFEGITTRGDVWVSWSGEPQSSVPGQKARFGTNVTAVDGGWIVDGTKVFATSAGGAQWAILLVDTAGPGGARHADGGLDTVLMLACDLGDASVSFDPSWWDPIGMRATVSYLARFDNTFIPRENLIGSPGQYHADRWQTRFTPHYTATFLGGAEAAFRYAQDYVRSQQKGGDPYVQQRIAEMAINIQTAHLWLREVARLWDAGHEDEAAGAGNRARYLIEHLAMDTVDHAIRTCGARSLNRPSPLERVHRDLSFYVRHDNADHVLATVGREALGLPRDVSFFRPGPAAGGRDEREGPK